MDKLNLLDSLAACGTTGSLWSWQTSQHGCVFPPGTLHCHYYRYGASTEVDLTRVEAKNLKLYARE